MKIPGIAYIIIGVFMAGLSGYVYKFIPKPDGTPNMSMAFFFFISIIFIIVGFIKLFFKKMDDRKESEFHNAKKILEKGAQHTKNTSPTQEPPSHKNRIEQQLNSAVADQNSEEHKQNQTTNHPHHTSGYAKTHPYHGVPQQGNYSNTQDNSAHHAPHTSSLSIIACKRCGDKNSATANYCHGCGFRLK